MFFSQHCSSWAQLLYKPRKRARSMSFRSMSF